LKQDEATVFKGMSKFSLFQTMLDKYAKSDVQEAHLPLTILIEKGRPGFDKESFSQLKAPFFIKADGCFSPIGTKSITQRVDTVDQAINLANEHLRQFDKLLIQGFSPGVGVGVFLLRWQGRILARFMHMRLHETLYGWSSYRKSWWQQEIYDDAEIKLNEMNWEGVAMMEYRWDEATDNFALIEMNGRFWGSLHLALYAEVNFPVILLDAFHGSVDDQVFPKKQEVYCRNAVLELRYLVTQIKDPDNSILSKPYFLLEYIFLTLNPFIKSDLFFPGDRKLFWLEIWGKILLVFDRSKGHISKQPVDSTKGSL
jgi:predicted ATP-grasp superfamily ATP-dependent carboligase